MKRNETKRQNKKRNREIPQHQKELATNSSYSCERICKLKTTVTIISIEERRARRDTERSVKENEIMCVDVNMILADARIMGLVHRIEHDFNQPYEM